jgi:hypothetical protein
VQPVRLQRNEHTIQAATPSLLENHFDQPRLSAGGDSR